MRRGTRVGQAYVALTADGSGINEEIVNSVDEAGPGVEKAGDEQGKRYGDHFSDGFLHRLRERLRNRGEDGALGFGNKAGESEGTSIGERLGSSMIHSLQDRLAGADKVVEDMLARIDSAQGGRTSVAKLETMAHSLRTAETAAGRLERQLRAAMKAEGLLGDVVSRNGSRKNTGLTSIDDWLLNTRFRNNALNILAKSMGGVIHGFEAAGLAVGRFVSNVRSAEEGASVFEKISAGFGGGAGSAGAEGAGFFSKGLSAIAASGPGAVVALAAVAFGASVLVSVLNALLAIVVALAATIASALVAALAVGSAGLVALAGAAGLAVLAFMSMTDAQKALLKTSVFKPIHEEAIGLGQTMLKTMIPAFAEWSKNMQIALALAQPLAAVMGGAFARAGSILTAALSGPGVQLFLGALTKTLPAIITNLSAAFGGFLNGTLALFSALLPYVVQFSIYLNNVATRFAAWATSAKGQNAIADFVDRAVNSLHSLMNFLGAVGGLITTVLFSRSGQTAGNNIFDDMTNAVRRFTAYLSKDNRLQKWFAEGVVFATALGQTIKTLGQSLQKLNQSGVIDAIARLVDIGAGAYKWFSKLPGVVQGLLNPLQGMANLIGKIGSIIGAGGSSGGVNGTQGQINSLNGFLLGPLGSKPKLPAAMTKGKTNAQIDALIKSLQASGNAALNATSVKSGGYKPKAKYHNPYIAFANKLIKDGPSVAAQIRNAILTVNKQAGDAIRSASSATSADSVQSALTSLSESITTSATETVNTAQSALNTAAQSLANATSKSAAKAALVKVRASQKDLAAALANQKRIQQAANIINAQQVLNQFNVTALLAGVANVNATLADYAEARSRVAALLSDANQKLTEALSLRDQYKSQVADSIKSFGSLLTAQAQSIDGVEQALTATDVTSNLQARLDKIKAFQNDLRLLLAQGLSNDAYKQIVDAGVEQGSTFADALLAGGNAAIQNTNSLVSQINGIADSLGSETSNRMYQAGVDAAQGLVDGLTSLSAQLDSAAAALGNSIADAVKRALGISSPSRVLIGLMDYVGDGAVIGLNNQQSKVGTAASALAAKVAINPSSTYSSSTGSAGTSAVSGNDQRPIELTVITPTEDPVAVAHEAINELVGRI